MAVIYQFNIAIFFVLSFIYCSHTNPITSTSIQQSLDSATSNTIGRSLYNQLDTMPSSEAKELVKSLPTMCQRSVSIGDLTVLVMSAFYEFNG